MLLKNFWLIFTTIAAMSNNVVLCQSQPQNISVAEPNREIKIVQDQEKITDDSINYKGKQIISHQLFGDIIADTMRAFIPFSINNEKCSSDGRHFMKELINQTIWAVQMYDSSAKYPTGVLYGEVTELGRFDQCMSTSSKQLEINAAYAVADMRFRLANSRLTVQTDPGNGSTMNFVEAHRARSKRNMLAIGPETMLWAVCVPDSCSADDVRMSMEHRLRPVLLEHGIAVDVDIPPLLYTSVSTATLEKSYGGMAVICTVIFICTAFTITGTLYTLFSDKISSKKFGFLKMCLNSYSIKNNMENLVADPKDDEFTVLNGFKLIGIFGVIIGHRVALDLGAPTLSTEFSNHIYEDFLLGFLKTPVIVEIFFIISGFLTHVIIDGRLKNGKPLKFFYLLAFRIIRILPMYITILLIYANVLPYISDGPMWKLFIHPEAEFCRKNWWTNLLFINNYVNTYEMCMFHSWYIACDMHFFVVGTLLTYIIHRWKKVGQYIFVILFLLSVYLPARYIYVNEQWGVFPYFRSNMVNIRRIDHFHLVYIKSHFRITTYLIGMAAAYIYLNLKNSKYKFSVASRTVGFIISFLLNIFCIFFITGYLYLPERTYNAWDHVLYFTFQRITYAITVSYFIVVASLSNFGIFSDIFKSKFCVVVSRLTYIAFLVHLISQLQILGEIRQSQYWNLWTLFRRFNADIMMTAAYSIPLNLIIEAPCRKIFNHVVKDRNNSNPDDKETDTNL